MKKGDKRFVVLWVLCLLRKPGKQASVWVYFFLKKLYISICSFVRSIEVHAKRLGFILILIFRNVYRLIRFYFKVYRVAL